MTPAVVIPIELGRLRRAVAEGDVEAVLAFTGRVLRGSEDLTPSHRQEAKKAFYNIFWVALEDETLCEQAGDLDALVARMS